MDICVLKTAIKTHVPDVPVGEVHGASAVVLEDGENPAGLALRVLQHRVAVQSGVFQRHHTHRHPTRRVTVTQVKSTQLLAFFGQAVVVALVVDRGPQTLNMLEDGWPRGLNAVQGRLKRPPQTKH